MAMKYISLLLIRLVLPAALLLSIALRPFGFSIIYLLLYLLLPLVSAPTSKTFNGFRGKVFLLNVIASWLLLLVHVAWHIVLLSFAPYGSILEEGGLLSLIGYNLGLVSYNAIDPLMAVHFLAPELIMAATSLVVYVALKKILLNPNADSKLSAKDSKHQKYPFLTSAGKYICLFLIMFSGIMRPSITSGLYFLVFMGAATAWAVGRPLERGFAVVGRCLMAIMAVHVTLILVYQCSWINALLPPDNEFARYFGLTKLVKLDLEHPIEFTYAAVEDHMWATLASPLVILFTYYILALETRELFKPKLIRGISPSKRLASARSSSIKPVHQDSTGSVVIADEELMMEDEKLTLMDEIITAIIDFFQVLIRSSYIATSIIMMAWSIMFHSWLTFVFLMWANIVWLCQDQRSFMLKTSPILVCYAMTLLLSQYIYGMNLTEAELPSNISEVNLRQIGLGRADGEPCVPLLIKSLFTCMFWVTLRQRVQEMRQRRQSAVVADMAAPLHLTVSAAASVIEERKEEEGRSRLLKALGEWLRAACARYWIYVVVIMLFVIGITGERMTIFRIIYMFLFLSFILMFQISWYWWRRLMYAFWITVIIYSMINLILIYIYQFDNFPLTIEKYLLINVRLQHDLGLEPYHPADLFVKLLTPTLFLIITIMQVHYFHKDFIALSDPRTTSTAKDPASSRPSQAGASTMKDDLPPLPLEEDVPKSPSATSRHSATEADHSIEMSSMNPDKSTRRSLYRKSSRSRSYAPTITERQSTDFREWAVEKWKLARSRLHITIDFIFLYLEIHLIKIVFISMMLLSVINVCGMHVPIMLMAAPALLLSTKKQRFCVLVISILISAYVMAKMVYQIDYIKHSFFDVNCTMDGENGTMNYTTYNNAEWLGFVKATKQRPLVILLKGYIGLIAIFTFYSLVNYRQRRNRSYGLIRSNTDKILFKNVGRKEADKDLLHCVKYLVNYGFYKFGVEITLICLMGVIGSRMDLYALFYSIWLLVIVSLNRVKQACVWPAFTGFVTVLLPIQYMLAVGFLPQLCISYPWSGDEQQMKHIRTWLFLPYPESPPHASKLIFDYFLLLFCSRQLRVFRVERIHGDNYEGGSNNENIGQDWETPSFVNPVPDFLSYVGSWLDVIKRMVFLGMLWVTLAIMFLTGTNRVNLFSMGYLIGSFIFLWQGTDFYLRPKDSILKWWSWLLRYNVCVVVIKALLQIPGCIFGSAMQDNACWLVQLFGIGCVDKFAGGSIAKFLKMQYYKEAMCSVPQEDIGLAWDGVCFAFLILQQRLFHSYYFYRVIDESKATTVLASRGADLIEELRQKQMVQQEQQESKILEKIKVKMERIKANQKKIQGQLTKEPATHEVATTSCRGYRTRPPSSHQKAIRSGDYYMFDEFDDTDVNLNEEESSTDEDAPTKELGIGKVRRRISRAHTEPIHEKDVDIAISQRSEKDGYSEIEEFAPEPEKETWFDKIKRLLETIWTFVDSFLVSITRYLMKYSRDYRYVSRTLSVEKKILKEKEGFGIGLREGSQMVWEPLPENTVARKDVTLLEEQDDSMFRKGKSSLAHLAYALWYAVIAHTDIACYVMVFINQIQSATILSIPLPLMVFLWGTLTIPRPTKTFWVTLIAYTEIIVLLKSMFQFEILPWNQKAIPANMPFTAPRIIGIERKSNYALYDLLLLLLIFLHRFMLKSLGLWKESTPEVELREDAEYPLQPEDTKMIADGRGEEVAKKYIKLHAKSGSGEIVENQNEQFVDEDIKEDADVNNALEEDVAGPSKPPEDDHYKVNDDEEPIIAVTTTLEDPYPYYPQIVALSVKRYLQPLRFFFKRMLSQSSRVTADVYAYMFLCDFLNFLVVIFGFAAFGTHQGDGGVQAYLEENKVPIPFLVMLILQFALIVIDRALYLRKFILGKILFQYVLILGVHIWMFFILPFITERTFNALLPPPMWYMIKSIYLLLSAYQIRCGYPRRIIGNFLCKGYNYVNMLCFRSFMAIPFVFELRTLMDWMWTDTSMTLMDWLKMEDVFANVFLLKCSRYVEDEFPSPRGVKKSSTVKYLLGGGVLAFVIAIIWFPLVFFAFGNSVGQPNPPTDVTVKIRIGPFLPVYQMSAQSHNIDVFTELDYTQLSNMYARDRTAQTFLSNYMYNDVAVVTLNPNSTMNWEISPPELDRLENEAISNSTLSIRFTYVLTHLTNSAQNPPTIEESREVQLEAYLPNGQRNPERDTLLALLAQNSTENQWLNVSHLFPKFVKVFNKGTAKPAYQLMPPSRSGSAGSDDEDRLYRNVQMRLEHTSSVSYWRVREACEPQDPLLGIPNNNCDMLVMYTFNDKLFPETLNFISGSGIIGLYTTFVFLASRLLRGFFSGIYTKIMFDDLPNVDRVLQLCLDIYLVREALELALEEDLFAKLVFLYRSPETMIKWSRPKEETDEQRALPPSR